MPLHRENGEPRRRRTPGRPLMACAVTEAAREAYERSSKKFLTVRRAAAKLHTQATLSTRQSEWLTYAAELRSIERSLEIDLRSINQTVSRLQSQVPPSRNAYRFSSIQQQAPHGVAEAATEDFRRFESNRGAILACSSTRSPECRHSTVSARLTDSITTNSSSAEASEAPTPTGLLHLGEHAVNLENQTEGKPPCCLKRSTNVGHRVLLAGEEASREYVNPLRQNESSSFPPITQLSSSAEDEMCSALLRNTLKLRSSAKSLLSCLSSCRSTDKKTSVINVSARNVNNLVSSNSDKALSAAKVFHQEVSHNAIHQTPTSRSPVLPCNTSGDSTAASCCMVPSTTSATVVIQPAQPPENISDSSHLSRCKESTSRFPRTTHACSSRRLPSDSATPAEVVRLGKKSFLRRFINSVGQKRVELNAASSGQRTLGRPRSFQERADQAEPQTDANKQDHKKQVNLHETTPLNTVKKCESHSRQMTRQERDASHETGRHGTETQDPKPVQQRAALMTQQNLIATHQSPGATVGISLTQIADFAALLHLTHRLLESSRRKLQVKEATAEQEVHSARSGLRRLMRGGLTPFDSLLLLRGSSTTAGKRWRGAEDSGGRLNSLSRLSTRSELPVEFHTQATNGHHTDSAGDLTEAEEELLREFVTANGEQASASFTENGHEERRKDETILLRDDYMSELETLEKEVKKQLNVYNHKAASLNMRRRALLSTACDGGEAKELLDVTRNSEGFMSREASTSGGHCDGLPKKTSAISRELAKVQEIAPNQGERGTPGALASVTITVSKETGRGKDSKGEESLPASKALKRDKYTSGSAAPQEMSGAVADTPAALILDASLERGTWNEDAQKSREPTYPQQSCLDRAQAITLFRAATEEFQHFKVRDFQQVDCNLLDRLHLIFPTASAVTLRKLVNIDKELLLLQRRRAATLWRYSRVREHILITTRERLRLHLQRFEEESRKREQNEQQQQRKRHLHERLQVERQRVAEQQAALRNLAEACTAVQKDRAARVAKKEQQQRAKDKKLIAEHREAKAAAYMQEKLKATAAAEQEKAERAALMRRHRHTMLRRREEDIWKSRMQTQARQMETLRQAQVIERLMRLAEKFAVDVPADAERVQQPTCASQARTQQLRSERQEAQKLQHQGHRLSKGRTLACFEVPHGYTVKELLSDLRLRFSTALHEAGLFHTRAGHEALLNLSEKKKLL